MVCFYIAVNSESAACTAPPEKRGVLQLVSLLIQVGNIVIQVGNIVIQVGNIVKYCEIL